jgi:hypothetical protein
VLVYPDQPPARSSLIYDLIWPTLSTGRLIAPAFFSVHPCLIHLPACLVDPLPAFSTAGIIFPDQNCLHRLPCFANYFG